MLCSQKERKVYHMQLYFLGQGPEEAIQVSPTGRPPVERCPEKQVYEPAVDEIELWKALKLGRYFQWVLV